MTDLEERLRTALSEAASYAPSAVGLGAYIQDRRSHRRRWVVSLAAAAAAAAIVLALPLVSAYLPANSPSVPAETTDAPQTEPRYQSSCAGTVTLVSSAGNSVVIGAHPPPRMTLRVGDVLTIDADGPCAPTVGATPQSEGVLRNDSSDGLPTRFIAVGTGTVIVVVTHPMCAALPPNPECRGGVADDGAAEVIVVT